MVALKFEMGTSPALSGSIQDLFARVFLDSLGSHVATVNPAMTQIDWTFGTHTTMTSTGVGLAVSGTDLTAGTLHNVDYFGSAFVPALMQIFHLNTDATEIQGHIDDIKAEHATNGETIFWTYDQFVERVFSDRKQTVIGNADNNIIHGGNKDDKLKGGGGDDTFWATFGDDIINGGSGINRLTYQNLSGVGDIVADIGAQSVTLGDGSVQTIKQIQKLAGGSGNDSLTGNHADNTLEGNDGVDVLTGKGGNDVLSGGGGGDVILGNGGNDFIRGGAGHDQIEGGAGDDEIFGDAGRDMISGGADNDKIWGGTNHDTISGGAGQDEIYGEGGNDIIYGGTQNDYIEGGAGDDSLNGGSNRDTLKGGQGDDFVSGDTGADILFGGTGNDEIFGGTGNDKLFGGSGNDDLRGQEGNDRLTGNAGDDTFVFGAASNEGHDTITDFSGADEVYMFTPMGTVSLTDSGPDTLVTYDNGSILIKNVSVAALDIQQDTDVTILTLV